MGVREGTLGLLSHPLSHIFNILSTLLVRDGLEQCVVGKAERENEIEPARKRAQLLVGKQDGVERVGGNDWTREEGNLCICNGYSVSSGAITHIAMYEFHMCISSASKIGSNILEASIHFLFSTLPNEGLKRITIVSHHHNV